MAGAEAPCTSKLFWVANLPTNRWGRPTPEDTQQNGRRFCLRVYVEGSVALILYRLSVYRLYWSKILVSAISNITKCILVTKFYIFMGKLTIKLWNYVLKGKNLNKVVYQIGYRYRQIFLIHYRLSECQLNSISVHHYLEALENSRGSYPLADMETSDNTLDQVHSIFVKFGFDKIARVRTYYISAYI